MSERHPERMARAHRLRAAADFAALKSTGVAFHGPLCLLVVLSRSGEITRVGFVASRRGVGDAPARNRARRRLREIVRRRWPRLPHAGYLLMFIASRATLAASHQALASEVERLLANAGALRPLPPVGH